MEDLAKNPLFVSLASLLAGIFITSLVNSFRNKSGTLGYVSYFNRIGISAKDEIFGEVRVNWQGHDVRNLHHYTIEIENETIKDFENIELKIYAGQGTILLNQKTEVVGTPYIVEFSPAYAARLRVPEGEQATKQQLDEYNRSREYTIPVLNRGQKLRFTYLCTRPNDDFDPEIYISTPSKGVKLTRRKTPYVLINPILGAPVPSAIFRGLWASLISLLLFGYFSSNVWVAAIGCMVIGLFAQPLGAILFRIEKFIIKAVAG